MNQASVQHFLRWIQAEPRIQRLATVGPLPYLSQALADWGAIVAVAWASEQSGSRTLYLLACLLIAGRQHAFFALAHEAAHYRIFRSHLWNDVFSNALFAYPVCFDTDAYRQNHLKHHTYLNTDADPDWARKIQLPQWQFPLRPSFVLRTLPAFLLWNGPKEWFVIMLHLGGVLPLRGILEAKRLRKVALRAAYYAGAAALLTRFSLWAPFFQYWAVPLLFVFPSLQRVRSVAEHFGLARTHELNNTRNVLPPWYERILFGPHRIHYHLAHHLVASVPFYHLPELHQILLEHEAYRDMGHENASYLAPSSHPVLRDLLRKPGAATGDAGKKQAA